MLNKILAMSFISLLIMTTNSIADELPIFSGVGGNFTAINTDGEKIEFSNFKGKVVLLAFGYTNCADICPFTLGYLKQLHSKLTDKEQQEVKVVFVTVDPEYDTASHLNAFLGHFNKDFIGLTGSREQIDTIASLFQVRYQKIVPQGVPTKYIRRVHQDKKSDKKPEVAPLYNHSISAYLIDKKGNTRKLFHTGTLKETLIPAIRTLIDENTNDE